MMYEAKYFLLINMCTSEGYVETGRFYVSRDEQEAYALFASLAGTEVKDAKPLLSMDLVCQHQQGPVTLLGTRACTLCELGENVKMVLKETFKMRNLG